MSEWNGRWGGGEREKEKDIVIIISMLKRKFRMLERRRGRGDVITFLIDLLSALLNLLYNWNYII